MKNNQYASTTLTINLQAIRNNYRILKAKAPKAKVSSVVKANAYGLGLAEIVAVLIEEGCDTFFVANLDEALELRKFHADITIFVLHGIMPGQEEIFDFNKIIPVLNSISQVNIWDKYAIKKQKKLPCILHFDTGMNRLGIEKPLSTIPSSLNPLYLMTHLACADDSANKMNSKQLKDFQSITKDFKDISLTIANSSGIFLGSDYHQDLVRPGIAIYGANPSTALLNPMQNVIKLTSKILQLQHVDSAGTVGYGALQKITSGTKIATIAVGYADGYLRSLSNSGICAIDGVIVPVIGRVSMDLVTIDVTKIPAEKLDECREVELIGENIPVDIVAKKAGTISYEILTSLGNRYKKIYI